jgi:hypothetical protein
MITKARATAALMLTTIFVITSCGGTGSSGSAAKVSSSAATTPSSPGASPSTAQELTSFRSATYGYVVTPPGDWMSIQALEKWDGRSELTYDSAQVDQFGSGYPGAFGVAAPWKRDLAADTKFLITWVSLNHGETCPPKPNTRAPVTIGGQPGVLLAYNCGILINIAATVHDGVAYWFTFRDPNVQAETDPTDHAIFLKMLRSVHFPD